MNGFRAIEGDSGMSVSVGVGNAFGGEWGIEVGGMPIEGWVMTMVGIDVGALGGDVSQLGGDGGFDGGYWRV
jgi:hypothetical protein